MKIASTLILAGALLATPVMAQDGKKDASKRILDAIALPEKAEALRGSGMSADEVRGALDAAEMAGVSATETTELIDAATSSEDGDAWQGNFGSYVKSQLDSGLRGQELAEAIKAEKSVRKADKEAAKAAGTWKGRSGEGKAKGAEKAAEAKAKGADKAADAKAKGADKAADAKAKGTEKAAEARAKGADKAEEAKAKGRNKAAEASQPAKGKGKGK
jgi:hypothetical protein